MSKPREFWLTKDFVDVKGHGYYYTWRPSDRAVDAHVVEYSALEALQKRIENLRAALEYIRNTNERLAEFKTEIAAGLEMANEALEADLKAGGGP